MTALAKAARLAISSRLAPALGAALLGIALLYLAGFAQADAVHDGAHDARHSANFPCH
jgi:cobalt transporter subunit CbtB